MSYRKRRLRKKLHVGEFQEFYIKVTGTFSPPLNDAEVRSFIDCLIDYVDVRKLHLFGITNEESFTQYIDGSKTRLAAQVQRTDALEFLNRHPKILGLSASAPKDSWYDNGEEHPLLMPEEKKK